MLRTYDKPDKRPREIRDAEHRGDEISHDIGRRLEQTFVTPFDREEIHALISGLDDILDLIEEVADTFVLYHIEAPTRSSVKQAAIVVQACEPLHEALGNLRGFKDLDKYWIEVHRLENEGDRLGPSAIADLFDDGDPIEVLKWRKVYSLLEETIDKWRGRRRHHRADHDQARLSRPPHPGGRRVRRQQPGTPRSGEVGEGRRRERVTQHE